MRPETMKHAISCMLNEIGEGDDMTMSEIKEKEAVMELIDELCSQVKNSEGINGWVEELEEDVARLKEDKLSLVNTILKQKEAHHNYRHQVHLVGQHKDEKIAELQSLLAANNIEETSSVLGWDHSLADFAVTDRIKKYLNLQHELALCMNELFDRTYRNGQYTHYCTQCKEGIIPEQRLKDIVCPYCRVCNHALIPLDNTEELCDNTTQPTKEM